MHIHPNDRQFFAAEYGSPKRRPRVDPAKSLALIKRIRAASGACPAPTQQETKDSVLPKD